MRKVRNITSHGKIENQWFFWGSDLELHHRSVIFWIVKFCKKHSYFMGKSWKTKVSRRFSLRPIQWYQGSCVCVWRWLLWVDFDGCWWAVVAKADSTFAKGDSQQDSIFQTTHSFHFGVPEATRAVNKAVIHLVPSARTWDAGTSAGILLIIMWVTNKLSARLKQ
jgi:hypothetical protein